jgi:O-antigen ligase
MPGRPEMDSLLTSEPVQQTSPGARRRSRSALVGDLRLALPGVITAYLAFGSGGFFPGQVAVAAVGLSLALLLRITTGRDPLAGWTLPAACVAAVGALLAAWTLLSVTWSDSASRALVEFDRVLLYVLAFGVMACFARQPRDLTIVLRWVLLAIVGVAIAGLATRLLPGTFEAIPGREPARLAHPLTYWNAMSVMCALGVVLALHAASGADEPAWVRVLAGAALPVLVVAGYFPLSRGGIVTAVVAVAIYAVVAHPRRLPVALVTAGLPAAAALVAAYRAEALATATYFEPPGPEEGRTLVVIVAAAVAAAALLRSIALPLERRLDAVPLAAGRRRAAFLAAAALIVAVLAVGAATVDAPLLASEQYRAFVDGNVVDPGQDLRRRLTASGNNGRLDIWKVGLDAFEREPVRGIGAGTFQFAWERDRPAELQVVDGHSLYLEMAAELGVVGLVLLVSLLTGLLLGVGRGLRGPERHARAAVLAGAVALLVHAGIDWDWDMPALFVWLFGAAGVAWARAAGGSPRTAAPARLTRVVAGLACLVLAVTPALVLSSQTSLVRAAEAFDRGDCATAVDAALDSRDALGARSEPFELLGYCNLRGGEPVLAVRAMEAARSREPRNWRPAYGLAVALALAGEDPRPAIAEARRLNPRATIVRDLQRALDGDRPARWRRAAARARLPF